MALGRRDRRPDPVLHRCAVSRLSRVAAAAARRAARTGSWLVGVPPGGSWSPSSEAVAELLVEDHDPDRVAPAGGAKRNGRRERNRWQARGEGVVLQDAVAQPPSRKAVAGLHLPGGAGPAQRGSHRLPVGGAMVVVPGGPAGARRRRPRQTSVVGTCWTVASVSVSSYGPVRDQRARRRRWPAGPCRLLETTEGPDQPTTRPGRAPGAPDDGVRQRLVRRSARDRPRSDRLAANRRSSATGRIDGPSSTQTAVTAVTAEERSRRSAQARCVSWTGPVAVRQTTARGRRACVSGRAATTPCQAAGLALLRSPCAFRGPRGGRVGRSPNARKLRGLIRSVRSGRPVRDDVPPAAWSSARRGRSGRRHV